jgi:hypothetical protein
MLNVTLRPASEAPVLPDLSTPGLEIWRERDGRVAAYGGSLDGSKWMRLPGLAAFVFVGESVVAYPEPVASEEAVHDAFRRNVLPLALQVLGYEVIHASAVRGPRGVVALCAVSETGKSTIAYGLSRLGHELWADDAVAFDVKGDAVRALPLPFSLRLRAPSAAYYDVDPDAFAVGAPPQASLAALCILERVEDAGTASGAFVDRLAAADAFSSLLTHAYCFSLEDAERKERMLRAYLALAGSVPIFRAGLEEGLERVPAMLDTIEQEIFGTGDVE